MNFAVANIFKAAYRLGSKPGVDVTYDLEKIIWFAQRELARHKNALTKFPFSGKPDARDFGAAPVTCKFALGDSVVEALRPGSIVPVPTTTFRRLTSNEAAYYAPMSKTHRYAEVTSDGKIWNAPVRHPTESVALTEGWPSPRCSNCQSQPCLCINQGESK